MVRSDYKSRLGAWKRRRLLICFAKSRTLWPNSRVVSWGMNVEDEIQCADEFRSVATCVDVIGSVEMIDLLGRQIEISFYVQYLSAGG